MNAVSNNHDTRGDLIALRGRKTLPGVIWIAPYIDLSPSEWVDITDPAASEIPAHIADAAMKRGR